MYLDIGVVVIYMGAMLLLGWYGMRRAKTQEDFLVAGRNLGPGFYMGTMAATVLGGASTVGTVRLGYVHGISGFWLCAALGAGIVVLNLFLAKPLLKLRIYTVTQVLERRYSPATRRVSALVMMAYALMLAATSVIATGTVMHVLFDLPFWAAVLLGGGVVVIYSAVGGMWSLTLTDIVQFVIKTVGLMFVLLPICIMRVGGWDQLVARLPAASFDFTTIGWSTIATYFVIYFFGILIGQDIWQRVFTARTTGVARVAGSVAGVYCAVWPGRRVDRHGRQGVAARSGQSQQRLRRHRAGQPARRHPRPGHRRRARGHDVHGQRRHAGDLHRAGGRPAARCAAAAASRT